MLAAIFYPKRRFSVARQRFSGSIAAPKKRRFFGFGRKNS